MDVVDRVIAALNARQIDDFVACYSADASLEDGYDHVGARGHSELRERYAAMFDKYPELRVDAGWRTTVGAFVVQEETVTGRSGHERHIAIYLIADDLIARERLIA